MTNKHTLDLARQWAADLDADRQVLSQDTIDAAADLISSLPDEWVDADELREVIDKLRGEGDHVSEALADELADILPAPPAPRTLADMTPEEQDWCRFMAAEVATGRTWYIIGRSPGQYGQWIVVTRSGRIETRPPEHITPLPDLPRLEWPASEPAEDTPEPERTRPEDVKPALPAPRPRDVPVGEPWQVEVDGRAAVGYRNDPKARLCWAIAYRDTAEHDWLFDSDVTLVARLVPETTEQDDVPVTAELDWIDGRTRAERVLSHSLAQAEQIERLQAAVRELTHDPHWLTVVGALKEGDMK